MLPNSYNYTGLRLRHGVNKIFKHPMFKDSAWIFIVYILLGIIGILTSVVLARSFSLYDMGRYQLILTYLALGSIAGLPGMNTIITKGILKDYDNIFFIALKKSIFLTVACSLLLLGSGIILYYLQLAKELGVTLMVLSPFIPLIGLEKYESYFQGKRKFRQSRRIAFFYGMANLLVVGGTAYLTKSLFAVIAALFFVKMASVLIILGIVRRGLSQKERNLKYEQSLLKQGWQLSGLSVFNVIVGHMDRIILGAMDPALLALYHVGGYLVTKIKDGVKSLLIVPIMHWSKLSKEENIKKISTHGLKFFLLGTGLTIIIWIIAPWFIPFLYGKNYYESIAVARWLSLILPVLFWGTMVLTVNIYQGDTSFYRKTVIGTQIFYIVSLAVFVPLWGMYGVVASFVARAYVQHVFFSFIYILKNKNVFFV